VSDERFATNGARVAHREQMVARVADCIRTKTAAEWFDELDRAGIPAGPINRITQALADVQAQHRGMVRSIAGMSLVGSPVRLDGARADSDLPPPKLGEHTGEVLGSLGLEPPAVERLKSEGIIA
jgi:formyl-CoA transferase